MLMAHQENTRLNINHTHSKFLKMCWWSVVFRIVFLHLINSYLYKQHLMDAWKKKIEVISGKSNTQATALKCTNLFCTTAAHIARVMEVHLTPHGDTLHVRQKCEGDLMMVWRKIRVALCATRWTSITMAIWAAVVQNRLVHFSAVACVLLFPQITSIFFYQASMRCCLYKQELMRCENTMRNTTPHQHIFKNLECVIDVQTCFFLMNH
jgi:hypothetical protein